MYDRAQNYKEAVLGKLTEHDRSPIVSSNVNWMPDSVTGRFVSPFCDIANPQRSVTPDKPCNRTNNNSMLVAGDLYDEGSSMRLA